MTYEELRNANTTIKTTNVQGKEYAEVNQRIKVFRMLFPEGFIRTTMISNENGVCVFKAEAGEGDRVLATGTAYEKEGSSYINKTSYIENCETSAVGRALGMLGIGIDTAVASAEEVQNAIANQPKKLITAEQKKIIEGAYAGETMEKLLTWAKIKSLDEMTMETASGIIKRLSERKK